MPPRPSELLTKTSLRNASVILQAISGSTNALVHLEVADGKLPGLHIPIADGNLRIERQTLEEQIMI